MRCRGIENMNFLFYTVIFILLEQIIESQSLSPQVSITAIENNFSIRHVGEERTIIDEDNARRWDLAPDSKCKNAVSNYFGKSPNDCYLHELTPWVLYPSHGWQEVTSVYKPIQSRHLNTISTPSVLTRKTFLNYKDFPLLVKLSFKQPATDKVTHKKKNGGEFGPSSSTKFSISVLDANVEISYDHTLGNEETIEKAKTVDVNEPMIARVPPNSNLTLIMTSNNVKATFEVTYSNSLQGYVAVNYNPKYQDHHFWGLSTAILEPLKNPKVVTEEIELNYFTQGIVSMKLINLRDSTTMNVPLSDVINPLVLYAN